MSAIPCETIRLVREIVERERMTPANMAALFGGPFVEVFEACTKEKCSGPHIRPAHSYKGYYCSCLAAIEMRHDMAREANESACSGVATPSPNTALQASQEPLSNSRDTTSASIVDARSDTPSDGSDLSISARCLVNSSPQSLLGRMPDSTEAPSGAGDHGIGGAA
jgi:hypothetical protein